MSDKRLIIVPVTFESANRRKDHSVSLRFNSTLEVSTPDFAEMDLFAGKSTGWLLYSENAIKAEDIPRADAPEKGVKSKSERLYNALYVLWDKGFRSDYPDFEAFRSVRMETLIESTKAEIREYEA